MSSSSKRPERTGIMLAHPLSQRRLDQLGLPFLIQPKLNGERCWVEWFNEMPVLISSYGNEFKLPHITNALVALNLQGIRFDAELYIHGEAFETIHSIVSASRKELHPRWEEVQLHIFDFKHPDMPQALRLHKLESTYLAGPLQRVPTFACLDPTAWVPYLQQWISEGYEGIMFRNALTYYVESRTPALLKYKPTHLDEYTIVGLKEGTGWAEGMLGSFLVKGDDNTTFSVGSGRLLTKSNRRELWRRRDELIGKVLIVKHEDLQTSGGLPKCATAISLKDDEI